MGVHRSVLKSEEILYISIIERFLLHMATHRSILGLLSWFFLHWILLIILNPMSTCLGIVHGCAQSCAEK